jgi:3-hydroxypropionyl-coenzyme A dehydratase
MTYQSLLYKKQDRIVVITLNRPDKLNALSRQLRNDIDAAWNAAEEDEDVRIIIMTGAGRAFCAGADIGEWDSGMEAGRKGLKEWLPFLGKPERLDKIVIAAVNGVAFGGGMEIVMASDMAIAADTAQLGLPEAKVGLAPGFGMLRLHEIVGRKKAKEIMMTGEPLTAAEAERLGLINKVVPSHKLMEEALALANKVLRAAPLSVRFLKAVVNRDLIGEPFSYAYEGESRLFGTEDIVEGRQSFLEKRKPVYKGR